MEPDIGPVRGPPPRRDEARAARRHVLLPVPGGHPCRVEAATPVAVLATRRPDREHRVRAYRRAARDKLAAARRPAGTGGGGTFEAPDGGAFRARADRARPQ